MAPGTSNRDFSLHLRIGLYCGQTSGETKSPSIIFSLMVHSWGAEIIAGHHSLKNVVLKN